MSWMMGQLGLAVESLEPRVLLSTYPGIPDDLLTAGGYQIPDGHNGICTTIDQLCQTYAPVMKLNAGGNIPGDDAERYHPKPVDLITAPRPAGESGNWPKVYQAIRAGDYVAWNPIATITNIAQVGAYGAGCGDYFIDLPGTNIYQINAFYDQIKDSTPDTVYATVFADPATHLLVLKYHFYYYGNDFWDEHESDWEAATLLFDQSGPYRARYNRHDTYSERGWNDVETMGQTHPVIYVGEGGHASYFEAGHSQVNYLATEFHYGDGEILCPGPAWSSGYLVQVLPNDRTADLSNIGGKNLNWLKFEGRWGQLALPSILPVGNDGPGG
ncbi:MAG: LEPR-XLL domain-containing protein, partial [Planctomycetota bacterium]|nr:LEPR-XLL domain-containing protein [Planctomycetota bacterium]